MSDFGVTEQGFVLKRLADILDEAKTALQSIQDPITGEYLQPNFTSADPAMQIVLVVLNSIANAWEGMEVTFNQFDPQKATGAALSSLVELNGLDRKQATASTASISVTGTDSTVIPAGSIVTDLQNTNNWEVDTDITINSGVGLGTVTCQTLGSVFAATNTLNTIVTPILGWSTVNNSTQSVTGEDKETDSELRARRDNSTLAPGVSQSEAVAANLKNLSGVTYVKVLVNDSLTVNSNGIQPKSMAVIIDGGDDQETAKNTLKRKGMAVPTESSLPDTTTVNITDNQGIVYPISFIRPTQVPIYCTIILNVTNSDLFGDTDTAIDFIKNKIIQYAEYGSVALGVTYGFNESGFGIGDNVYRSRLYTPINSKPGHEVELLSINDTGLPSSGLGDVTIEFNELPVFTKDNIDITVNS